MRTYSFSFVLFENGFNYNTDILKRNVKSILMEKIKMKLRCFDTQKTSYVSN